jgi:hypothetical protein
MVQGRFLRKPDRKVRDRNAPSLGARGAEGGEKDGDLESPLQVAKTRPRVDREANAGDNSCLAASGTMAPITEEGE